MKKKETNLKEQLAKLEANIYLYELNTPLPCQRFVSSVKTCMAETNYAIIMERTDYYLVVPMCPKHLPKWAKGYIKKGGSKVNGRSNARKTKGTPNL